MNGKQKSPTKAQAHWCTVLRKLRQNESSEEQKQFSVLMKKKPWNGTSTQSIQAGNFYYLNIFATIVSGAELITSYNKLFLRTSKWNQRIEVTKNGLFQIVRHLYKFEWSPLSFPGWRPYYFQRWSWKLQIDSAM